MKKILLIFVIQIASYISFAQSNFVSGIVEEENIHENHNHNKALSFANIYWIGTKIGTTTDENGNYKIEKNEKSEFLIFSFMGFKNDTIKVLKSQEIVNVVLKPSIQLDEIVINERIKGESVSKISAIQTQKITTKGLQKLACCNLSESFENSVTVDVSYSDAVTGAKQIQMLGLAGIYSQILIENIPMIRGLAASYGLGYIPGTWMESIQISKGTSSVVNGYESTTGQINVEYKKPFRGDKLHLNLYQNYMGKTEGNFIVSREFNHNLSTMLLTHIENMSMKVDENKDGFLELPMQKQINVFNRWNYEKDEKFHSQFGVKFLYEDRLGGQTKYNKSTDYETTNSYGIGINTNRLEVFAKNGMTLKNPVNSVAIILSSTFHNQKSYFGLRNYDANQQNLYANLIYNTILGNTNHKLSSGLSFNYDNYNESLDTLNFKRIESVPGAFAEYTYSASEKLTIITGFRADLNSEFGLFLTPRAHFKYEISHETILRGSIGKGYRTSNIFAENSAILASSREIILLENFEAEQAWNYGVNITHHIEKQHKEIGTLSLDFYRTDFINQIIVDTDQDFSKVFVYNLDGKSYSNSAQIELMLTPFERFDFTLAGRFNDVKATINKELQQKPLVSKFKAVLAMSYATNHDKWKFDVTNQLVGKSRIPNTENNPIEYQREKTSPIYYILHAQITKKFKNWDFYIGSENITNFMQHNPIISANDPFGNYFDTSMIWGPIVGRDVYLGLRFSLK
jgi:outer membrane receptor for ferrienterochelin and colicin